MYGYGFVDVTDIENIQINDSVEIFGQQQSIRAIAKQCKTIVYEI